MEYLIYSDESNHDRSITKKNEETFSVLNIDKKNQSREYVRSYCVISSGINQNLKKRFIESENTLRNPLATNKSYEIKATDCLKITGKMGVTQVEDKYINHLMNCLDMIREFSMKLIIVNYNKIEYIIEQSLVIDIKRLKKIDRLYNEESVKYSYAKYIQNHYTDNLLEILFSEKNSQTDYKIKREILRINKMLKKYPLKKNEFLVGRTMGKMIEQQFISFNAKESYSWNYNLETNLMIEYLDNQNISKKYNIVFDKGTKATKVFKEKVKGNKSIGIVKDSDSKEDEILRFVDWMATFFGKLLRSYSNSMKINRRENEEIALGTVADLERDWFNLSKLQYELIQKMDKLFKSNAISFLSGVLADNSLGLLNYFDYVGSFESYEQFNRIELYRHGQRNNYNLNSVWQEYYKQRNILFDSNDTTKGITSEFYRNL